MGSIHQVVYFRLNSGEDYLQMKLTLYIGRGLGESLCGHGEFLASLCQLR